MAQLCYIITRLVLGFPSSQYIAAIFLETVHVFVSYANYLLVYGYLTTLTVVSIVRGVELRDIQA